MGSDLGTLGIGISRYARAAPGQRDRARHCGAGQISIPAQCLLEGPPLPALRREPASGGGGVNRGLSHRAAGGTCAPARVSSSAAIPFPKSRSNMIRRLAVLFLTPLSLCAIAALAQEAPDALVKRVSEDVP